MKSWISLAATVAIVAPLAAFAQSTSTPSASGIQPADAPRSQLEKDQTQNNGQATKYGAPDTGTSTANTTSTTKTKHATKSGNTKAASTPSDTADSPSASTPPTSAAPQTPTTKNPGK